MTHQPMTAIIVVTYHKVDYARLVLGNVLQFLQPRRKLFVIDNNSGPKMLELLGQVAAAGGDHVDITGCRQNLGKSVAVNALVTEKRLLEKFSGLILMDPDIIFSASDLDALSECLEDLESPGMISMDYYPWNSPKPPDGIVRPFPGKSGKFYEINVRASRPMTSGHVAGGVFGITSETARTFLNGVVYPHFPYAYYTEDAALDVALAQKGRINGYLQKTQALHLPETDRDYEAWKIKIRSSLKPPPAGYYDPPV